MNNTDFDKLDKILNVAFTNLYTLSKDDNIIKLSKVNLNDDRHWTVLNILASMCDTTNKIALLDMSWWQFHKLKRILPTRRFIREKNNNGITCDKFISDIEDVNTNFLKDPFLLAAKEYFPRKVKK